jgi:hypothetical protein
MIMSKEEFGRFNKNPKMRVQKMENVSKGVIESCVGCTSCLCLMT